MRLEDSGGFSRTTFPNATLRFISPTHQPIRTSATSKKELDQMNRTTDVKASSETSEGPKELV